MTKESAGAPARRTVVRHAARVIVLDADSRVLLFRFRYTPSDGILRDVWITPGGGLEASECYEEAATRELWEETGIRAPLGPCVWTRSHTNLWTDYFIEQHERYYVARVDLVQVERANQTAFERQLMPEYRWWKAAEIAASSEWFAPRALATALRPIIAGAYPSEPVDVGV